MPEKEKVNYSDPWNEYYKNLWDGITKDVGALLKKHNLSVILTCKEGTEESEV